MELERPQILVIDVSNSLSAAEAQNALNIDGYYMRGLVALPEGMRVVFARRVKSKTDYFEASGPSYERIRGAMRNADGLEEAALALVNAHPRLSGPKVSALLLAHGIRRGKDWVNKHRLAKRP